MSSVSAALRPRRPRARIALTAVAALGAAGALTGCATTMQEASRLQLNSARIRASEVSTRVTVPGHTVDVTRVALVRGAGLTAFVVDVHNLGDRAVSDLPITVGVRVGARRTIELNTAPGTSEYSYFSAHLPVVAAGGTLAWVYSTDRRLTAAARPFALVGATPSVPVGRVGALPAIRATLVTAAPAARGDRLGTLSIVLRNLSGVPQYQLQIYATAEVGGRYVAAGDDTVVHLGTGSSKTLHLGLLGPTTHARIAIEALPTIFQ